MKEKIGIFGGTFDPIHFGHINLALELKEQRGLKRVLFIPTGCNPLKKGAVASYAHRLAMAEIAICGIPFFSLSRLEEGRYPSYTVETLKLLAETDLERGLEMHLLIGEDLVPSLPKWRSIEEIFSLAPPFIASRYIEPGVCPLAKDLSEEMLHLVDRGWTKTPLLDISSTQIRRRIRNQLYCNHLLPTKVLDYIQDNGLYL
ncbi:MAG: hypothetical protein K0S07_464 [Chlamydiales bacterium]|jgi:nicotinate-nucleotide adenylyltransferase|nr:hypothetical protein [Chlamydiales bacterium]